MALGSKSYEVPSRHSVGLARAPYLEKGWSVDEETQVRIEHILCNVTNSDHADDDATMFELCGTIH